MPVRDPFTALPARSLALGVGGEAAYDGDRSSARAGASGAADARPPLIYWYTIDALRLDVASARSGGRPLMPTLTALRQESVSFDRAYVQSSFTKTSTASMFTGLWPQRHGVMHGWVPTWPEGGALFFDLDNRFYTLAEYLGDQGYETWTHRFTIHVQPGAGMLQGFDHIDLASGSDVPVPLMPERLFAYEHILGAHGPYDPSEAARQYFELPAATAIDPASTDWFYGPLNEKQLQELSAAYRAEVWDSDRQLAARLQGLRDAGLWDDAMIIVTSDHGEEFLDHGATQHSVQLYEEVLRVPLLVKFPAGHPWAERHGDHIDDRVRLVDLFPTIVELLGDDVSELPYALDGASLGPILEGSEQSLMGRDVLARVSFTSVVEETGKLALFVTDAMVQGPLKAVIGYRIRSSQDAAGAAFAQGDWIAELYDLGNDPREAVNLVARGGEYREAFEVLAGQLARAFAPMSLPGTEEAGPTPGDDGFVESELTDVLRALGYVGGSAEEHRDTDQR
ncbi:MAG: arylsulfatase A-like enzyme [Pseudohongiellaceae bacterium]